MDSISINKKERMDLFINSKNVTIHTSHEGLCGEMGLLSNGSIDEEGQMNKSAKKSLKITADSLWLLRVVNDNDDIYQKWSYQVPFSSFACIQVSRCRLLNRYRFY